MSGAGIAIRGRIAPSNRASLRNRAAAAELEDQALPHVQPRPSQPRGANANGSSASSGNAATMTFQNEAGASDGFTGAAATRVLSVRELFV
jgi:hypothetical protein